MASKSDGFRLRAHQDSGHFYATLTFTTTQKTIQMIVTGFCDFFVKFYI